MGPMTHRDVTSLVNRLEAHSKHSPDHLLVEEAVETIVEQNKRIQDLEAVIYQMDSNLYQFINSARDYDPVSRWDDNNEQCFKKLCEGYNNWHSTSAVGKIAQKQFIENQTAMRRAIVRSLKENLYRTSVNKAAEEILERIIRRYEDDTWGMV